MARSFAYALASFAATALLIVGSAGAPGAARAGQAVTGAPAGPTGASSPRE